MPPQSQNRVSAMKPQHATTNPTDAKKITQSEFEITFIPGKEGSPAMFSCDLKLQERKYDNAHRIKLYVTRKENQDSHDMGIVENPTKIDKQEINFYLDGPPSFQLVIIDSASKAKLFSARSSPVRGQQEEDDAQQGILPIKPFDTGARIWKLDMENGPEILVNNRIGDLVSRFKKDPLIHSIIFPVVLENILLKLADDDNDDDGTWQAQWRKWLETNGYDLPTEAMGKEERETWASSIVDDFMHCHCKDLKDKIREEEWGS